MAHPKETRKLLGRLWHLEDSKLSLVEARALQKHLKSIEEKRAVVNKTKEGYQVWWASK